MFDVEAELNTIARNTARIVVDQPGWMADIDRTCSDVRDTFMRNADQLPIAKEMLSTVADRAAIILRGYHAALAVNDTETVLNRYFDLMPPDIQAKIHAGAMGVLSECGVQVERYKDERGVTFLKLDGVEKLGVPADEMARMNALASDLPTPVGELHRVH
jgi:hypothetical protein